jgi:hypothetical protein
MLKIPKIINFFWDNSGMSYLQYLTIVSFHKFNPDWDIIIHESLETHQIVTWNTNEQNLKYQGKDYYVELKKLPYVKINTVDFNKIGFFENVSGVYKSDYIRWYLMSTVGGAWSDMDILYFKPLTSLNLIEEAETVICNRDFGNIIGFLMSKPDNDFFKKIHENSTKYFNANKYQSIGSELMNLLFDEIKTSENIVNLESSVFYSYNHLNIDKIFNSNDLSFLTDNSIGIHWYNGSDISKSFTNNYFENTKNINNVISLIIEKYEINK